MVDSTPLSVKTSEQSTLTRGQKIALSRMGSKNPMWKGDEVGYGSLHRWVKRRLVEPALCDDCKEAPPYDLANISQEYKRDLSDWEWLCRRCHMTKDGRMNNLLKFKRINFNTICQYCGKDFYGKVSSRSITRRFCSHECLVKSNFRKKSIAQISPRTGKIIKVWPSTTEAAKHFGIYPTNITKCLKGQYEHSAGYKWEYDTPV